MGVNRRQFVAGLGASLGAAVIGCGSDGSVAGGPDAGDSPDGASPPPDANAPTACTATSAMTPEELLAGIDTIVVLCMENRSFDHYLGSLRLLEGRMDIDGLTGTETNPAPDGGSVGVHLLENFTPADPPHGWDACHEQWNDGANDGFVIAHAGSSQSDVMGYHTRAQIPVTYALADQAAVCNRWFCGTLGPTWPNRYFVHCGTSNGIKSNLPSFGLDSIWDRLEDADVESINYYHDVPWVTGAFGRFSGLAGIERFFEDAEAGNLAPFTLIDPCFFAGGANDDHPDHDIRMGQALISSVVAALGQSPQWNRCLFVLTYDEHGGFYDHVAPPAAVGETEPDFQQLGFRVPSIVIGPTVRRGCAIDTVFEHSSILSTAQKKWGLAPLTTRATMSADLTPCIDPRLVGAPLPAPVLPRMTMSLRALAEREARLRGHVSHPELAAAIDRVRPPRALDRRADGDAIMRRVLRWGERVGAVKIVD